MVVVRDVLHGEFAILLDAEAYTGSNHEQPIRAGEFFAERFDRAPVLLAIFDEAREIVVEAAMDDAIGLRGPAPEAICIFEAAIVRFGASGQQRRGAFFRSGQAKNRMAGREELLHDRRRR